MNAARDFKSLASGEDGLWEAYEAELAPQKPKATLEPKQAPELPRIEPTLKRCWRCGKDRPILGDCAGCAELDQVICPVCLNPVGKHSVSYGSTKNRRSWWYNPSLCIFTAKPGERGYFCENQSFDPVKQEIGKDGRWKDIIEEEKNV